MSIDREKFIKAGIDIDDALSRFMNNESLYIKLLGKFKEDINFQNLMNAFEEKDVVMAFKYAHTLKGLAGNFSMAVLYSKLNNVVNEFRAGNTRGLDEQMRDIKLEYEKLIKFIDENI